jgi:AMP phosphorylase
MELRVKDLAISTGNPLIAIVNYIDAHKLDLHFADRIRIRKGTREIVAMIDITTSNELVLPGEIGLFKEVYEKIRVKDCDIVIIRLEQKPRSLSHIKKKLEGGKLNELEIREIVNDIIDDRLTEIELTYFVAAGFINELDDKEVVALTNAMINTGERLILKNKVVADKHCIGGVAGNRTTMLIVPILAAAGLVMPKTSSRAITSAAGTADTMEVLCDVSFNLEKMAKIVAKTGGCFCWGGAVNLAPADDKIIRVEAPMSLDPIGGLIASILAKKKSVSATHVIIDIPVGKGCKTESMKRARLLKAKFERIARRISMKIKVIVTDGSEPVGNGIGPALEARDVLWTLMGSEKGARDLREKSIDLAGHLLDLAGKTKKGRGRQLARHILECGMAYEKFIQIIQAQNAKVIFPEQIEVGSYTTKILAPQSGTVRFINNKRINKTAKTAGAPHDPKAGLYIHVHKGKKVKRGDVLFTIYADSKERLRFAREYAQQCPAYEIQ